MASSNNRAFWEARCAKENDKQSHNSPTYERNNSGTFRWHNQMISKDKLSLIYRPRLGSKRTTSNEKTKLQLASLELDDILERCQRILIPF